MTTTPKRGPYGQSLERIEYYGLVQNARGQIAEVLVIRDGGRQVSQTETGVTYRTMRAADADNTAKNRAAAAAILAKRKEN